MATQRSSALVFLGFLAIGSAIIDLDFTNATLTVNDLGGAGPLPPSDAVDNPNTMQFSWPELGYHFTLNNMGKYESGSAKDNGFSEGNNFGKINVKDGTCVLLSGVVTNSNPTESDFADETSFHFTIFDIDGSPDTHESVRINGFREFFVSDDTEVQIVRNESAGSIEFTSTTIGDKNDNPVNPRRLTEQQMNRAVSFLFADLGKLEMRLCVNGPTTNGGRDFLFAGVSELIDKYDGRCRTNQQLVRPQVSLDFEKGYMSANNLAGLGPETQKQESVHFANVGKVGTRGVDIVVSTYGPNSGGYVPANISKNGLFGYFGIINVACNSSVNLTFQLVDSATQEPQYNSVIFFGFYDFDQLNEGYGREVVTVHDIDNYFVTETTNVAVTKRGDDSVEFGATVKGNKGDNPPSPHEMTDAQKDKGVLLMFENTSSFQATLSVQGGPAGDGRNFMFAGFSPMQRSDPDMSPCADDKETVQEEDAGMDRARKFLRASHRLAI